MLDDQDWRRLVRYLSDECSDWEKMAIEKWIASDVELQEELAKLKKIWDVSTEKKKDWDVDKAWERFKNDDVRFSQSTNKEAPQKSRLPQYIDSDIDRVGRSDPFRRESSFHKWVIVISTIAAGVIISLIFFQPLRNRPTPPKPVMRVFTAHRGERIHLVLADDTKILLNADSQLKVPKHFSASSRDVFLRGEAYFEVTPRSSEPFLIHAGNSLIRDLDTHFVVMSYPKSDQIRVIVSDGKVTMQKASVSSGNIVSYSSGTIVRSNYIGILKKDGIIKVRRVGNLMDWLGWTEGKLVFDNTPLYQVINRLGRWYDLNISLKDSTIANRRLTATYVASQPQGEVLNAIALSLNLKYTVKHNSVLLYRKK